MCGFLQWVLATQWPQVLSWAGLQLSDQGRSKQSVTPSSVGGRNELLGLVEAVIGHCFHSRENSIPIHPVIGPSNFPRLTSLVIYCFWLSGHGPSPPHLYAYNPGYSFHISRHLLSTHPTQFRGPHRPWHELFLSGSGIAAKTTDYQTLS